MIGKMFRPLKIVKSNKRGFYIENKYKSNFGGIYTFSMELNINSDYKEREEVIELNILDTNLKIALLERKNKIVNNNSVIDNNKKFYKTSIYRKMVRMTRIKDTSEENPGYISVYDRMLKLTIGISEGKQVGEVIQILMYPIIIDNEEYLFIDSQSVTPIKKNNESGIKMITKEQECMIHGLL